MRQPCLGQSRQQGATLMELVMTIVIIGAAAGDQRKCTDHTGDGNADDDDGHDQFHQGGALLARFAEAWLPHWHAPW